MSGFANVLPPSERVSSDAVTCAASLDIEFPTLTTSATVGSRGGLSAGSMHCVVEGDRGTQAAPVWSASGGGFGAVGDAGGKLVTQQGESEKGGRGTMAFSEQTQAAGEEAGSSCLDFPQPAHGGTSLRTVQSFAVAESRAGDGDRPVSSTDKQLEHPNRHSNTNNFSKRPPHDGKPVPLRSGGGSRQFQISAGKQSSLRAPGQRGLLNVSVSQDKEAELAPEHCLRRDAAEFPFRAASSHTSFPLPCAGESWATARGSRLRHRVEEADALTLFQECGPSSPYLPEEQFELCCPGKVEMEKLVASLVAERDLYKAAFGAAKEELDELEAGTRQLEEALKEKNRRLLHSTLVLQKQARQLCSLEGGAESKGHLRFLGRDISSKEGCTKKEEGRRDKHSELEAVQGRVTDSKAPPREREVKEGGEYQGLWDCPQGVPALSIHHNEGGQSSSSRDWANRAPKFSSNVLSDASSRSHPLNSRRPCQSHGAGSRTVELGAKYDAGSGESARRQAAEHEGEQAGTPLASFPAEHPDVLEGRTSENEYSKRKTSQRRCSLSEGPPRYLLSPSAACSHFPPSEQHSLPPSNWFLQDARLLANKEGKSRLLDAHRAEDSVSSSISRGPKLHQLSGDDEAFDGAASPMHLTGRPDVCGVSLRPGLSSHAGIPCRSPCQCRRDSKYGMPEAWRRRSQSEPPLLSTREHALDGTRRRAKPWCIRRGDGATAPGGLRRAVSAEVRNWRRYGSADDVRGLWIQGNGGVRTQPSECLTTPGCSAAPGGAQVNRSADVSLSQVANGVAVGVLPSLSGGVHVEAENAALSSSSLNTRLEKTEGRAFPRQAREEGAEDNRAEASPVKPRRSIVDSYIWLERLAAGVRKGVYPSSEVLLRGIEEQEQLLRVAQTMEEEREQYIDAVANLHAELRSVRDEACIYLLAHQQQAADLQQEADEVHAVADMWFQAYLGQMLSWQRAGYGSLLHGPSPPPRPPVSKGCRGSPSSYGSSFSQTGARGRVVAGEAEAPMDLCGQRERFFLPAKPGVTGPSSTGSGLQPAPAFSLRAAEATPEMQVLMVDFVEDGMRSEREKKAEEFCWQVVPNDDDVVRSPGSLLGRKGKRRSCFEGHGEGQDREGGEGRKAEKLKGGSGLLATWASATAMGWLQRRGERRLLWFLD